MVPSRGSLMAHVLRAASVSSSSSGATLPGFLVPAWPWQGQRQTTSTPRPRQFSTTTKRPSKLGRTPITIPAGVELSIGELKTIRVKTSYKPALKRIINVKGPLGELNLAVPEYVKLQQDSENKTVLLSVEDANIKEQQTMWGTSWSYLNNYVTGVSEGHTAILRLVGVGYRASLERRFRKEQYPGQKFLCLKLGYTHSIEEPIPKGVTVTTPSPTRVLLEGTDREAIMSFAGTVRMWRPPEPYKGKGVFINDQTIKLKQKKIK
ncbi:hypothetical protein E4U55_002830 [Claviceps digitariae]|nr:hypothetical protein E4U55_002830 [Claviceps digitariae]